MIVNILTRDAAFFSALFSKSCGCPSFVTHMRCFDSLPAELLSGPLLVDLSSDGFCAGSVPDSADAFITESSIGKSRKGIPEISKYQPANSFLKQLSGLCLRKSGLNGKDDKKCKVICFSSPSGGAGTSTLAMSAALCGKYGFSPGHIEERNDSRSFYLSLEHVCVNEPGADTEGADIGEVLFALGDESLSTPDRIMSMISYSKDNVGFFRTGKNVSDRSGFTAEKIRKLLDIICTGAEFDTVFVDCPFSFGGLFDAVKEVSNGIVFVADGKNDGKSSAVMRAADMEKTVLIYNHEDDESVGLTVPDYPAVCGDELYRKIGERLLSLGLFGKEPCNE